MLQAKEEEDRFARAHVSITDVFFSLPHPSWVEWFEGMCSSGLDNVFTIPAFSAQADYD